MDELSNEDIDEIIEESINIGFLHTKYQKHDGYIKENDLLKYKQGNDFIKLYMRKIFNNSRYCKYNGPILELEPLPELFYVQYKTTKNIYENNFNNKIILNKNICIKLLVREKVYSNYNGDINLTDTILIEAISKITKQHRTEYVNLERIDLIETFKYYLQDSNILILKKQLLDHLKSTNRWFYI